MNKVKGIKDAGRPIGLEERCASAARCSMSSPAGVELEKATVSI